MEAVEPAGTGARGETRRQALTSDGRAILARLREARQQELAAALAGWAPSGIASWPS